MSICGLSICDADKPDEPDPATSHDRLVLLEELQSQLLTLEEQKLEHSRLVRLLEAEVRKEQLRRAVQPSFHAYLLTRVRQDSYWLSSQPELYSEYSKMPPTCGRDEDDEGNFTAEENLSSCWSEISDRYKQNPVETQRKPERTTINTSALKSVLFPERKDSGRSSDSVSTIESLRKRKFVQVSHSRNISGFFGNYSLYHCTLHTPQGQVMTNEKRYSDFAALRESLLKTFSFKQPLPELPQKKLIGKLKDEFVRQRQNGLEDFMNSVYLRHSVDVNQSIEQWLTLCK